jgi:protein kinase C substrate 80K-H
MVVVNRQADDDDTMPEYNDETKQLIQIADRTRREYDDIHRDYLDVQRQIEFVLVFLQRKHVESKNKKQKNTLSLFVCSELKKQLNVDIGRHGEYAAFIDQCYDYDERDYIYRVCMFKEVKQISRANGNNDVLIGRWDSWSGPANNRYERMTFNKGVTCWNGPTRSMTVTLQCGIEHRIMDVREPSRCEYAMLFETPSACDENIATSSVSHLDHAEF